MSKNSISLFQLNKKIKGAVQQTFPSALWVSAEIAELRENRNGHCYIDLVEKDKNTDQVIARMKAMVWNYSYRMIKPYFETTTGQPLTSGIKILVQGAIEFQELYGMSFIIRDIDPAYTLGDLEQKRREVLLKLKEEGILNMNKELELPLVPQRIAIISSPTAAGYDDFTNQLSGNPYQIDFVFKLFPAAMQGQKAPEELTKALDLVFNEIDDFDIVVIIRGGGASLDLICFDDYQLACHIAQFPLPIITGIGHERDISVADMVAHTNLKTPTAVAEFLISGAANFLTQINEHSALLKNLVNNNLQFHAQKLNHLSYTFVPAVKQLIQEKKHHLLRLAEKIPSRSLHFISQQNNNLKQHKYRLTQATRQTLKNQSNNLSTYNNNLSLLTKNYFKRRKEKLLFLQKNNQLNDPSRLLEKGFSITYQNGKAVKNSKNLKPGSFIETQLSKGFVISEIKNQK